MKKPLRRLIAGLSLATACAAGGLLAATEASAAPADTAWGAPSADDTAWGTPPADGTGGPVGAPNDTAWG